MKSFIKNPLEFILNQFGYSMIKKRSLIFDHMQRTTNNSYFKRMYDNNNLSSREYKLWDYESGIISK